MMPTQQALKFLMPIIFMAHNAEEYLSFDKFKDYYAKFVGKKFSEPQTFLGAVSLLSVFVTTIIGVDYYCRNKTTDNLTKITFFSILINGIQHCISSLFFKKMLPGTFTSILLIFPYSIAYLMEMKKQSDFGVKEFMLYSAMSILFTAASVLACVRISYWLVKNNKNLSTALYANPEEHQELLEVANPSSQEEALSKHFATMQLSEPPTTPLVLSNALLPKKPIDTSLAKYTCGPLTYYLKPPTPSFR